MTAAFEQHGILAEDFDEASRILARTIEGVRLELIDVQTTGTAVR